MFWRVAGLATTSPVDTILDKDSYTLEELLDEDDLIQECKSLNNRLITFLRAKEQVLKMVQYVVEQPPDGSDDKRNYKFPFISCEVFTCEIDQILNTVVEEQEILDLLFSFPQPERQHSNLLSGYFSKVVNSLLLRKTPEIMSYLQAHQDILKQLADLVGTTSIMEVVMRLVGAHDEILMYHSEKLVWLAQTPLLDLLVEQLGPQRSSDVQANAAEVLSAIARTSPAPLALKLASPTYVHKLFQHVLEEPRSMTSVINSLAVCITLLGPRRQQPGLGPGGLPGFRAGQPPQQQPPLGTEGSATDPALAETIAGMLERLGALLELLDTSKDDRVLQTTYGQLAPPLGIHRLKVVEFLGVLIGAQSEQAFRELIQLGGIKICLDLFFRYHFNNSLHHHVEKMLLNLLDSGNQGVLEHLLAECDLLNRILAAFEEPHAPDTRREPGVEEIRGPTRSGYMGHLTRIANRIAQLAGSSPSVDAVVAQNEAWGEWQRTGLKARNQLENVYKWACGRPASLDDRPQDSDDDEFNRTDFDIATISLTSNAPRSFQQPRYGQPMMEPEEEEARASSTALFDAQMGSTEQGMTELRIDDSPVGTSTEASSALEATTVAAEGLASATGGITTQPVSSSAPVEASQSLFTSPQAGGTEWIAFQDEPQQQHSTAEAPGTDADLSPSLDLSTPSPSGPLSTSYATTPRPDTEEFSQHPPAGAQHPMVAATVAAAAAAESRGEALAAPLEGDSAPPIDLFANAPPEFRVHPQLVEEGMLGSAPAPTLDAPAAAAETAHSEVPVALETGGGAPASPEEVLPQSHAEPVVAATTSGAPGNGERPGDSPAGGPERVGEPGSETTSGSLPVAERAGTTDEGSEVSAAEPPVRREGQQQHSSGDGGPA